MHDLRASDLNQVLEVGRLSNECNSAVDLQNETVTKMQHSLHADSSVMINICREGKSLRCKANKAFDHPESEMERWCSQYQLQDPFVSCYINEFRARPSNVIVSNQVIGDREYQTSKFYNDFLRPMSIYHVMVVGLRAGNFPFGLIGFHRPKSARAFSDREVALAELMSPYIVAANQKVCARDMVVEREQLIETLASDKLYDSVILLDDSLSPTFVSKGAAALLKNATGRHVFPVQEQAVMPPSLIERCKRLARAIVANDTIDGLQNFDLQISASIAPVSVSVRPIDYGSQGLRFMVCLKTKNAEPALSNDSIKRFGLTSRQADIAQLVGVGMTNADIAGRLCISTRTVENHLRTVYEKAGVNNRTSLVYRMAHGVH